MKKWFNKLLNNCLRFLIRIKDAFVLSLDRIAYSIFGNLFPLFLGPLILVFIKEEFHISELLSPQNLIIYSATFSVSSLYIWRNNGEIKKNDSFGILFYIIIIIIITIMFAVSYLETKNNTDLFELLSKILFGFTVFLYGIQEIKKSYIILLDSNNKAIKEQKSQYKSLEDKFNNLPD